MKYFDFFLTYCIRILPSFMFSKIKNYKLILINKYDASAKEYNPKNIVLLLSSFSILIILIFTVLLFMPDISQLMSLKSIQNHKKNNLELQSVIENQKNIILIKH